MRSFLFGLFFFCLFIGSNSCKGQAFSPYSRYGLGYLHSDVFSATRGMGGITAGYSSPSHINFSNPASYADIAIVTFEVGANADAVTVKTKDSVYNGVNGSVNHIALGIPLIRGKWGMSVGMIPFSHLNYNFALSDVDTSKVYTGTGSLYHVYLGTAYKYKGFSLGVNLGYLFGSMDYTKGFSFTDSINAYNVSNVTSLHMGGFIYNIGAQYKIRLLKKTPQNGLKNDIFLTVGAQGSSSVKVGSRLSSQWQRFVQSSGGDQQIVIDTPLTITDRAGKVNIPYNFSVGVTVGYENWWMVGLDFKYAGWSQFSYDLNDHPLGDSWRIMLGGCITPNYESKKFLNRLQFKAGGYYGTSEIIYQSNHLTEYGGTLGLSVPIVFGALYREAARFHFSADLGSRSPGNKDLISESYYRFHFGFTLNNVWFVKRKFD